MKKRTTQQELNNQWERAVERAVEDKQDRGELDAELLNDAAGLHVESGVKGGWTSTCSCHQTCGTCDICS